MYHASSSDFRLQLRVEFPSRAVVGSWRRTLKLCPGEGMNLKQQQISRSCNTCNIYAYHMFPTWTLSSCILLVISLPVAELPFKVKDEPFDVALRLRRITRLPLSLEPLSSISMNPESVPFFTKEFSSDARPRICNTR
jgi:hypothetical protein